LVDLGLVSALRIHGEIREYVLCSPYTLKWKQENHCTFKVGVTVEIEGEEKPALYAEWINY
jgi:hypothetical protein